MDLFILITSFFQSASFLHHINQRKKFPRHVSYMCIVYIQYTDKPYMKLDGFKKKLQDIQWFNILRVKYIKKWFEILNFSCITLYTCITLNTIA